MIHNVVTQGKVKITNLRGPPHMFNVIDLGGGGEGASPASVLLPSSQGGLHLYPQTNRIAITRQLRRKAHAQFPPQTSE